MDEKFRSPGDSRAIKAIVLGPPASGKTRLARYLARYYRLPYIDVKSLLAGGIVSSVENVAKRPLFDDYENCEEYAEYAEGDDDYSFVGDFQRELDEIRKNLSASNDGRLDDATLSKLVRKRLEAEDCRKMGYVMDGFPKTFEQAEALFGATLPNGESSLVSKRIMPSAVLVLAASEQFLLERVASLSEKEMRAKERCYSERCYSEERMIRRLREYRSRNAEESSPLRFFEERDVCPFVIPIEHDLCPDMFPTIQRCLEILGEPKSYATDGGEYGDDEDRGIGAAGFAEEFSKDEETEEKKRRRVDKMMEWTRLMEKLKREEEERIYLASLPIRQYLERHVFPTLTGGLLKLAELRPNDPIDFLAEYLFDENPEGKMFEPDYASTISTLLSAVEGLSREDDRVEDRLEDREDDQLDGQRANYSKCRCQRAAHP